MTMTPELWKKVSEALEQALSLALRDRKQFLQRVWAQDEQVATEVEALLREQQSETASEPRRFQ